MDNEKFLRTLEVTGKYTEISAEAYKVLTKSKVNIQKCYSEISKLYTTNNYDINNIDVVIAMTLFLDREGLNESEYLDILKTHMKYSGDKDLDYLYNVIVSHKLVLGTSKNKNLLKIKEIAKYKSVDINGRLRTFNIIYGDSVGVTLLQDRYTKDKFNAIKIKSEKVEYLKIQEKDIIEEVLNGDFDLMVVPSLIHISRQAYFEYSCQEMKNNEYLDFLSTFKLLRSWINSDNEYWQVYNSNLNLKPIIEIFIDWKDTNINSGIELGAILSRFEDITDKHIKEVGEVLWIKRGLIAYKKDIDKYIESLITRLRKTKNVNEYLEELKSDNTKDIKYIVDSEDRKIYNIKRNNKIDIVDSETGKKLSEFKNKDVYLDRNYKVQLIDKDDTVNMEEYLIRIR